MNSKSRALLFAMFSVGSMVIPGLALAPTQKVYAQESLAEQVIGNLAFFDDDEEEAEDKVENGEDGENGFEGELCLLRIPGPPEFEPITQELLNEIINDEVEVQLNEACEGGDGG